MAESCCDCQGAVSGRQSPGITPHGVGARVPPHHGEPERARAGAPRRARGGQRPALRRRSPKNRGARSARRRRLRPSTTRNGTHRPRRPKNEDLPPVPRSQRRRLPRELTIDFDSATQHMNSCDRCRRLVQVRRARKLKRHQHVSRNNRVATPKLVDVRDLLTTVAMFMLLLWLFIA